MTKKTPFYDAHLALKGKMVDFAGWMMPLHYGSQLEEHHRVRQSVGLFDVSHMGVIDITGPGVMDFLRYLLANNIDKISDGQALYSCLLNEQGGVLDDLIVYRMTDQFYRLVVNAGTRDKDLAWIKQHASAFQVVMTERTEMAILAVQGPEALSVCQNALSDESIQSQLASLKPFSFLSYQGGMIARTGYTGEDGFEWIFPANEMRLWWDRLLAAGASPCGLGARDTLRLEAGYNLYGADMDESVTPLESNLAWTISFNPAERQFIGRDALEQQREQGVKHCLKGLILEGPGVLRNHQQVMIAGEVGEITSGGYSPTLEKSIALARLPCSEVNQCEVMVRNKWVPAKIVKPAFVRRGQSLI